MFWLNSIFSSIWIDGQGMTAKKMAKFKNQAEFMNVYADLVNEALSRYSFEGLPDTVNERVVLESLLWYGSVCFFMKEDQVLALPGLPTAAFTLYGDATEANIHGRNGFVDTIKLYVPNGDDSKLVRQSTNGTAPLDGTGVWVRENRMVFPFINYCIEFAEKIADTYRTIDTIRLNMKRPYFIVAEESILNSVKAYFNKRDNNEEYIVSSGVFPADKINLMPFEKNPEDVRASTGLVEWYYAQFRKLEGYSSNTNVDKKAQISIAELNRDSDVTDSKDNSVVEYLQEQLDFVNEKLGTNITVKSNIEREENEDVSSDSEQNVQSVADR